MIKNIFAVVLCVVSASSVGKVVKQDLVAAALERTTHSVRYDGAYVRLDYPMGDVPSDTGVCTDVIIRSYREVGIDFQQLIHEDIKANFSDYPSARMWGLNRPDKNIDHRRVPNIQAFLTRQNAQLPVTKLAADYLAGDLVTWMVNGNLPHIGIVVERRSTDNERPLIVHNIGRGPELEDMLFNYPITGHYRFLP